jgi:hypothetical protein
MLCAKSEGGVFLLLAMYSSLVIGSIIAPAFATNLTVLCV